MELDARILEVRGRRILLDSDLAALYGVATKRLNEHVRKDPARFPSDFVFLLSAEEWESASSRLASATGRRRFRRYLPYGFTYHGALAASSVLRSRTAIGVSLFIIRVVVAARKVAGSSDDVQSSIKEFERRIEQILSKEDPTVREFFAATRALIGRSDTKGLPFDFLEPSDG